MEQFGCSNPSKVFLFLGRHYELAQSPSTKPTKSERLVYELRAFGSQCLYLALYYLPCSYAALVTDTFQTPA